MSTATERLAHWEQYWQRVEFDAHETELRSRLDDFVDLVVEMADDKDEAEAGATQLVQKALAALDGLLNAREVIERLTAELAVSA